MWSKCRVRENLAALSIVTQGRVQGQMMVAALPQVLGKADGAGQGASCVRRLPLQLLLSACSNEQVLNAGAVDSSSQCVLLVNMTLEVP